MNNASTNPRLFTKLAPVGRSLPKMQKARALHVGDAAVDGAHVLGGRHGMLGGHRLLLAG